MRIKMLLLVLVCSVGLLASVACDDTISGTVKQTNTTGGGKPPSSTKEISITYTHKIGGGSKKAATNVQGSDIAAMAIKIDCNGNIAVADQSGYAVVTLTGNDGSSHVQTFGVNVSAGQAMFSDPDAVATWVNSNGADDSNSSVKILLLPVSVEATTSDYEYCSITSEAQYAGSTLATSAPVYFLVNIPQDPGGPHPIVPAG